MILIAAVSLVFAVTVDDELYRLCNTVGQLVTIVLLIWQQRHVRRIEPEVQETAAVVRRQLGERNGNDPVPEKYYGPERRKVN